MNENLQQSTTNVVNQPLTPAAAQTQTLMAAPFNKDDGTGNNRRNTSDFAALTGIQLTTTDVVAIRTTQEESKLRDEAALNTKATNAARTDARKFEKAMQDSLTDAAKSTYTTNADTLKSAFNTSQWAFKDSSSFQLEEGRSGAADSIRVDTGVTAKYKGPAETLVGKDTSLSASFHIPVPASYYDARISFNETNSKIEALESESMRIRRDLANLPALERQARAAIATYILDEQGQSGLVAAITGAAPMKALE